MSLVLSWFMSLTKDQSYQPKPKLWVLHNMPRSGGTLLSKCLGSMSEHILLSEIHPDAQHAMSFNALHQAQQWHGLLTDLNWQAVDFIEAVLKIQKIVSEKNQKLILRDWSHVDYLGPPVTDIPRMVPSLINTLSDYFDISSVQLVRHPLDTWLSLRRLNLIKKHKIELHDFLFAYRSYLEKTNHGFRLVYEDFLKNPSPSLKLACDHVGLSFDESFINNWFRYKRVTGDTSNSGSLRSNKTIEFRARRHHGDIKEAELEKNDDYQFLIRDLYE